MSQPLPPLPQGFVLDGQPAALPPLPPGFVMESPAPAAAAVPRLAPAFDPWANAMSEAEYRQALVDNQGLASMFKDSTIRFGQASRDLLAQGIDILQPDAAPTISGLGLPHERLSVRFLETAAGAGRGLADIMRATGVLRTPGDVLGEFTERVSAPLVRAREAENQRRIAAGIPTLEQETAEQGTTQLNNIIRAVSEVGANRLKSEEGKAAEGDLSAAIKGGLGSTFQQVIEDPLQTAAVVIPQMLPMLGATVATGGLLGSARAAIGTGAFLEGANAAAQAGRDIMLAAEEDLPPEYHARVAAGETPAQVRMDLARRASDTALGTTTALTGATGLGGLSATRALGLDQIEDIAARMGQTGARGRVVGALGTAAAEAPTEFADEAAAALGANAAEVDVGIRELTDLFSPEVAAQGLLGAAAGGTLGGITGAAATPTRPAAVVDPATGQPRPAQPAPQPTPQPAPEPAAEQETGEANIDDIIEALEAAGIELP
ncbi:MAG: hypothetical protein C0437_07860, partial [Ralstonia sp.]|nr:hypothetical protein [Ralstonia sp.]